MKILKKRRIGYLLGLVMIGVAVAGAGVFCLAPDTEEAAVLRERKEYARKLCREAGSIYLCVEESVFLRDGKRIPYQTAQGETWFRYDDLLTVYRVLMPLKNGELQPGEYLLADYTREGSCHEGSISGREKERGKNSGYRLIRNEEEEYFVLLRKEEAVVPDTYRQKKALRFWGSLAEGNIFPVTGNDQLYPGIREVLIEAGMLPISAQRLE
ncbi:hypothetical protein [Victivallis vadensis]|uniref:hypothetical protein n=2 Tax=Victivallis vadensis TaxID=172901 RepID=UPI00307F71F0